MIKVRDITEAKAIDLFTSQFGTNLVSRYEKFMEEVQELKEVFEEYLDAMNNSKFDMLPEIEEHLIDEFSDVQGTFTHLASLFDLYQQEMLHNCIDKVTGRMIDPNYKRFDKFELPDGTIVSMQHVPEFDDIDKIKSNKMPSAKHMYEIGKQG